MVIGLSGVQFNLVIRVIMTVWRESDLFHHGDYRSTWTTRSCYQPIITTTKFVIFYCPFYKHANSLVHKPPSQLRFSLLSITITITSNEPWNTETHKMDRNPPITNHKSWPFEPDKVKFYFLTDPLRWLTVTKNAIVSWLLNFTILNSHVCEKRSKPL